MTETQDMTAAPQPGQQSTQDAGVQTLRAVACLLVVALHVIGSSPTSGMQVGEASIYREFADLFAPLRIPLFTFLSGFVYAYYPVIAGRVRPFARKKLYRLGLPFLTVTTIYFLLTFVAGDVNGKLPLEEGWKIYVFPYVHLWFLQAIALIFAVTVVLERAGALATFGRFLATLACAVPPSLFMGGLGYDSLFSHENAIYLLPFFLLGLGANRFREILLQPAVAWVCAVAFTVTAAVHVGTVLEVGAATPTPIVLAIGLTGVLALLYFTPRVPLFERIGAYSFAIYLFHPFAIAPSRKIMQALDLDPAAALFVVGLVAGVLGPIVFEHLAKRVPLARRLLLGQRPDSTAWESRLPASASS